MPTEVCLFERRGILLVKTSITVTARFKRHQRAKCEMALRTTDEDYRVDASPREHNKAPCPNKKHVYNVNQFQILNLEVLFF